MRRTKLDKRLSGLLDGLSDDKRILAEDLLKEMAFLAKTMKDLKKDISENGATEFFKQGSNELIRPSASFTAYIAALGKFGSMSSKVARLLPKDEQQQESSLEAFLTSYDTASVIEQQ